MVVDYDFDITYIQFLLMMDKTKQNYIYSVAVFH